MSLSSSIQQPHRTRHNGAKTMDEPSDLSMSSENRPTPMIGNVNSPSASVASVSSEDDHLRRVSRSSNSIEMVGDSRHLHLELRRLTEALANLRRAFQETADRGPEYTRSVAMERLGLMLGILRPLLTRYGNLQTPEVMASTENLIKQVTQTSDYGDYHSSTVDFFEALDALRAAMSHSVSEFVAADCESSLYETTMRSSPNIIFPSFDPEAAAEASASIDLDYNAAARKDAIHSVDQVDSVLMRHDRGVDMALERAKIWSKYTKDVIYYVEKRIAIELDWAKNMAKLAQERRPVLKEESHLPFQSNFCTALDVDLEMCTKTQQACSLLLDCNFVEPLKAQKSKHDTICKSLHSKWNKERKRLKAAVIQLKKAKDNYIQRHQDYERCHEAVRIAEQGAEIGATAEKNVDKRKRSEEDALQKTAESEAQYRMCVEEANDRHRNILLTKTEILRGVRELIFECDQVMKEVTVNYFQQLHQLLSALPDHYASLCENSRHYEPGTQFMEYVKTMPETQVLHSTIADPFSFEPFTGDAIDSGGGGHTRQALRATRSSLASVAAANVGKLGPQLEAAGAYLLDESGGNVGGQKSRREAWTPGAVDPSDTESVESERSSPSGSPLVSSTQEAAASAAASSGGHGGSEHPVIYFDNDSAEFPGGHRGNERGLLATSKSSGGVPSSQVLGDHEIATSSGIPTSPTTPPRRKDKEPFSMSNAAISHKLRKMKTASKCIECESYVLIFTGVECTECGMSSHKKCLGNLTLTCGHRRLPRKMATFGVDLTTHLQEANSSIPTVVVRCVQEINDRGLTVQGIYRVSGGKQKIDRLCQAFENSPAELVDLTNIPPNVIADVLKNYMRQLPEPVLTNALSPEFILVAETYPVQAASISTPSPSTALPSSSSAHKEAAVANSLSSAATNSAGMAPLATAESSSPPAPASATTSTNTSTNTLTASSSSSSGMPASLDEEQRTVIKKLRDLCRRLPPANYHTLGYLMHHLSKVAAENEANCMTASNLAIVFAPTLMKTNKDIGLSAVDETKHHARVIELLIVYATHIFGPLEQIAPRESQQRNDHHHHHHHRGPRPRGINARSRGSRDSNDLISSQTERRGEVAPDDFSLPGLVSSEDQGGGSNENIFMSDDDDDADPIPMFLLEGSSGRPGRSPMLMRGNSSPPLIIKQSLKNFSGLEGVTPGMLSTQDSLEVAQAQRAAALGGGGNAPLISQSSAPAAAVTSSSAATARRTVHQESNMPVATTSEVSTAVFHKVGKKKQSIDEPDNIFGDTTEEAQESTSPPSSASTTTLRPSVVAASAASASSTRSGSLSEEASMVRRRGGGSKEGMSTSMPATILNLEENRVTIQVPGVHPSLPPGHRPSNHPAVVKQSSIDRDEA